MSKFYVGAKVVCIGQCNNIQPLDCIYTFPNGYPILHKVYVINKLILNPKFNLLGLAFVGGITSFGRLAGTPDAHEVGFDSREFRLLEEIQEENKYNNIQTIKEYRPEIQEYKFGDRADD